MLRLFVLVASAAAVLGGKSPSADYVRLTFSGERFSNDVIEDGQLDVPGLVAKYSYPIEVHNVITEDGYILTMHRIPHGRDQNSQPGARTVAFLMHGLQASSAEYVLLGPGNSLGYILAEEGYDVWIGNARGNYYSRRHAARLDPDRDRDFWRFSWDEIGNLDLPAFLDYIERVTGQTRLHYIGHSQGGTSFYVLNSLRPEYNQKFISCQALAPAALFRYNENKVVKFLASQIDILEPLMFTLTTGEFLRNREWVTQFAARFCYGENLVSTFCKTVIASSMSDYFNQTMIPVYLGHSPAGSSFRQGAHYWQNNRDDAFRRYDHGPALNLVRYGSITPPDYDVSLITAPIHIHYAVNDAEAFWKDVELMASKLPNAILHLVDSKELDHLDFLWAYQAKTLVYERVLSLMKEAEQES